MPSSLDPDITAETGTQALIKGENWLCMLCGFSVAGTGPGRLMIIFAVTVSWE